MDLLAQFDRMVKEEMPRRVLEGLPGVFEELGLFSRMEDERINVPDVYCVGFGLGHRGGVKPTK